MLLAALYLPRGTRFERLSDGFAFVYPDPSTRIEARERLAPLRRARAIFDGALGIATTAPIHERLTHEGEPAALLDLASATRRVSLGIAYGDHHYRLVIGSTADPAVVDEVATCVRQLTLELSLGLAPDRRRRYRYTPPKGWSSLSRHGLITDWFAPRFPSDAAILTVLPASPIRELPSRAFDRSLYEMKWGGYQPSAARGPFPLAATHLRAQEWRLEGAWPHRGRTSIDIVVLDDNTSVYTVRLEHDRARAEEHRATLHALVASIRPIVRTPGTEAGESSASLRPAHVVD